jgi:TPR repeat protein
LNRICLGDGVSVDHQESEPHFRQAVELGDVRAQMRLGICLLSSMFGRFDFDESRRLFDLASISCQFDRFVSNQPGN